jgi:hypothetical protein
MGWGFAPRIFLTNLKEPALSAAEGAKGSPPQADKKRERLRRISYIFIAKPVGFSIIIYIV